MPAEMHHVRPMLEQQFLQVAGPHGPRGDQLQRIAILSRPNPGGDGPDLFIQRQGMRLEGVGRQEENLDLAHRQTGGHARSHGVTRIEAILNTSRREPGIPSPTRVPDSVAGGCRPSGYALDDADTDEAEGLARSRWRIKALPQPFGVCDAREGLRAC